VPEQELEQRAGVVAAALADHLVRPEQARGRRAARELGGDEEERSARDGAVEDPKLA